MAPKITGDNLETIRAAVAPLDTAETRERYRRRDIPRAEAVKDIDTRYRWDLFYAAGSWRLLPTDNDYNSAHITTALRAIVPALEG